MSGPTGRRPDGSEKNGGSPGWPGTPAGGGALFGAEDVGVAVIHFEGEAVDRGGVDPAAFEAPAVFRRIPGSVLAAVLGDLLVRNDRRLHRLVPFRPECALGAVELEERERRVVPVVEIDLAGLPDREVAREGVDGRQGRLLRGFLDE